MKVVTCTLFIALLAMVVQPAVAITVDGTKDAEYGPALAVQTVQTQFGDATAVNSFAGSELDAAYARVEGGMLYLMLTGNLEANFNKLEIFIDSKSGGQNTIDGADNPPNDNWAAKFDGLTFDTGFAPDYLLIARNGSFEGDRFDFDYAVVGGGATDFDNFFFVFGDAQQGAANTGAGTNLGFSFDVAFDNSNEVGVTGGTDAADQDAAAAVLTGVELGVPLASLGGPIADLKVAAMVNGSNHDFLSNQILAGFRPPQDNLGTDGQGNFIADASLGAINLADDFNGTQFTTISHSAALGDVNFDGQVNGLDVNPFINSLINGPDQVVADMNQDGTVNGLDVSPFVDAVVGAGPEATPATVPEPSSVALVLATVLIGLVVCGWRRVGHRRAGRTW